MSGEKTTQLRRALGPWTGLPLLFLMMAVGSLLALEGKDVRSGAFLIGDGPYYASAAVSLWEDHDLDLENQLRGGLEIHQKQIALGRNGAWVPKHPILMSVCSAPFYPLFGVGGFLLFNEMVWLVLAVLLWYICRRHVPPAAATLGVVLALEATFMRAYQYNFSPDLFSSALVLGGILLLLRRRDLAGGLTLGLSTLAKVTNLFLALLAVALLGLRKPRTGSVRACAGLAPGVGLLMAVNLAMFGGLATTGYDRTLVLQDGSPAVVSHKGFFDVPVLQGAKGQLLD